MSVTTSCYRQCEDNLLTSCWDKSAAGLLQVVRFHVFRYSKRDAIINCAVERPPTPSSLLKGVDPTMTTMKYLHSTYGDPRYDSEKFTLDIVYFKSLQQEKKKVYVILRIQ